MGKQFHDDMMEFEKKKQCGFILLSIKNRTVDSYQKIKFIHTGMQTLTIQAIEAFMDSGLEMESSPPTIDIVWQAVHDLKKMKSQGIVSIAFEKGKLISYRCLNYSGAFALESKLRIIRAILELGRMESYWKMSQGNKRALQIVEDENLLRRYKSMTIDLHRKLCKDSHKKGTKGYCPWYQEREGKGIRSDWSGLAHRYWLSRVIVQETRPKKTRGKKT